ncbi:MAG TPA: hypothetical protein VML94_06925 [Thermoplasmata archaeon]|nr:hypothetical protein [Thermoplasmata archaeon]
MGPVEPLSSRMRAAFVLLGLYLAAVITALAITVAETLPPVRLLAVVVVAPIVVLIVTCLVLCWRRSVWGFAGAAALGVVGVGLRIVVSARPSLEVGGGLPLWVSVLYITLGTLVVLGSVGAVLELRAHSTAG